MNGKPGAPEWEPLLSLCFAPATEQTVPRVRELLKNGANPNAFYIHDGWPDSPLSCLYLATGYRNNPELARVLLEAGASVNDGESLYHSTEHADLACMKLLLEHGASPKGSNALKHMLDRENIEGVRLLLAAGADPNERNERGETSLHWAVWRDRSRQILAALIDGGAEIDAKRQDGRTAYALAIVSGQTETAALLASRGANTDVPPPNPHSPADQRLLPDMAAQHRTAAVRALLAAGFPVDARGEAGGTALHWACWKGYPDLVALLLKHGASITIEDHQYHATPPGWWEHGSVNCGEGDYAAVRILLQQAGAAG